MPNQSMQSRISSDVDAFFSGVSFRARVSQDVITRLADMTASHLEEIAKSNRENEKRGRQLLSSLKKRKSVFPVSKEEEIVSNLLEAEHTLAEALDGYRTREDHAVRDSDLYGRNEINVTSGYKAVIEGIESLIDVTQKIRWAVMESAEDYGEPADGPVSAEELLARLG